MGRELPFNGYRVFLGDDGKVLGTDNADGVIIESPVNVVFSGINYTVTNGESDTYIYIEAQLKSKVAWGEGRS